MSDKLEKRIQNEITRRVLEKYESLQEEHERHLDTDATIEALEDITSIPRKELDKIAHEVRSLYLKEHQEKRRWQKIVLYLMTICVILFLSFTFFRMAYQKLFVELEIEKAALIKKMKYEAVFTTGIKDYKPVNSINKISISNKKLYFYIRLLSLEANRDYHYFFKIYNTKGTLILETSPKLITSPDNRYNIWCWYSFDTVTDIAGDWRFEAYLDGVRLVERIFAVHQAR